MGRDDFNCLSALVYEPIPTVPQYQEFASGLPSEYYPGPILLQYSNGNMARSQAQVEFLITGLLETELNPIPTRHYLAGGRRFGVSENAESGGTAGFELVTAGPSSLHGHLEPAALHRRPERVRNWLWWFSVISENSLVKRI